MKQKIIGFDLDGVICPDIRWEGDTSYEGIKRLHDLRDNFYPIFYPHSNYVIITGRPIDDKDRTFEWLNKNRLTPIDVHFLDIKKENWNEHDVIKHKSYWINYYLTYDNKYNMVSFVESDLKQVYDIVSEIDNEIPVYHFSDFVVNSLNDEFKYLEECNEVQN